MDGELTTSESLGGGATAADLMITRPKVLPADASVGDVRELFDDDHVVMVLLGERGRLLGTLLREDLPDAAPSSAPALRWSVMTGRTVSPAEPTALVCQRLSERGRRLAVVDPAGELLGLVCLKRRRHGFCSDAGVAAREQDATRGATAGTAAAVEARWGAWITNRVTTDRSTPVGRT